MKKKVFTIITIVCIAFTASAFVTGQVCYIPLQVTDIDPTIEHENPHKGPVVIPSVSIDDHTLYFGTPCDGYTLNVVDSNDVVVYTTVIPVGATSLVLPSTLSGEDELQIIQGNYCFYGPITL